MRKIDLYITNQQYAVLKIESEKKGITFSEVLRKIIDSHGKIIDSHGEKNAK